MFTSSVPPELYEFGACGQVNESNQSLATEDDLPIWVFRSA